MHNLTFTIEAQPQMITGSPGVPLPSYDPQSPMRHCEVETPDFSRIIRPVETGSGSRLWLSVKGGGPTLYDGWVTPESLAIVLDYLRSHPENIAAVWRCQTGTELQSINF